MSTAIIDLSEGKSQQIVIPPRFEDAKSPEYRYVFATGVFGGLDPNDGKLMYFLDRFEPETVNEPYPGTQKLKKIVRELQVEVHVSPSQFKSISIWMSEHVKRYEQMFGPITSPEVKPKYEEGRV
jgi:hypothetical protein